MTAPKVVTVSGKQFQLSPLPVLQAARVNGQLAAIFGPLLMGQVRDVSSLLLELPDAKQEAMVANLLSTTIYLPTGEKAGALELKDPEGLNAAFGCDLEGMYALLFEILEYNKFPFFAKLRETGARYFALMEQIQKGAMEALEQKASGSETPGTSGSDLPMSEDAKRALDSKSLGTLPPNSGKSTPSGG